MLVVSMVKFQFVGLKGHIVRFNPLDGDPAEAEAGADDALPPTFGERF